MTAEGQHTENLRTQYPRVARAFDLYLLCRTQQLFHIEIVKDGGKRVDHKIVRYVTGFAQLPGSGGLLDQPCWTIDMFEAFRSGENQAAAKILAK